MTFSLYCSGAVEQSYLTGECHWDLKTKQNIQCGNASIHWRFRRPLQNAMFSLQISRFYAYKGTSQTRAYVNAI